MAEQKPEEKKTEEIRLEIPEWVKILKDLMQKAKKNEK